MSVKSANTDRHHGGPGSSHQDATEPDPPEEKHPRPGEPTSRRRSSVSGGGGERDAAHSHDPNAKP
jgi:hypothetical protein